MGERGLDFSLPLLSVRRFSSPSSSNSSELVKHNQQQSILSNGSIYEHEEVKRSATVPFHWEQIPGKPKDEQVQTDPEEEPSVTLKVPPGRESDASLETRMDIVKSSRVVNEDYDDNVGSEQVQTSLALVEKRGKSWGFIRAKNYFSLLVKLIHSPTRNTLDKDLPQIEIEKEQVGDESPLKYSLVVHESCKNKKITSSKNLFKYSLQSISRNRVHVQRRFGLMDVDSLSKSAESLPSNQKSVESNVQSDYENCSSLTPPLPKAPSESWLCRAMIKNSDKTSTFRHDDDASDDRI